MNGNNESVILALKAAWLLPMDRPAIRDGCIVINGNRIDKIVTAAELEESLAGRKHRLYDYGEAIILPGLINLHAHLEHAHLGQLAQNSTFLEWLPTLMQATSQWSFEDRVNSVRRGTTELIATGTTYVVDFSYSGASLKVLAQSGLRGMVGLEIFGVNELSANDQWQGWLERYDAFLRDETIASAVYQGRLSITAAPHAPYTVCPALWHKTQSWALDNNRILLTHLAESQAEYNWFDATDESMKQFLITAFSKKDPAFASLYESQTSWKKQFQSPVTHLHKEGLLADNLLAAHVVQINDPDIDLLARGNVAIAHCPRSNKTLNCGRAPLEKLLATGLRVGLGTDGAASSGDTNLLSEARFAVNLHGDYVNLGAQQIVELLTVRAAACLKVGHKLGSLTAGKLADLAVFALPGRQSLSLSTAKNPYELLLSGQLELKTLLVNGETIQG